MRLNILVDNGAPIDGNIIDVVYNVTVAPPVGSTVTTSKGIFVIEELGIDYKENCINAWANIDYDEF